MVVRVKEHKCAKVYSVSFIRVSLIEIYPGEIYLFPSDIYLNIDESRRLKSIVLKVEKLNKLNVLYFESTAGLLVSYLRQLELYEHLVLQLTGQKRLPYIPLEDVRCDIERASDILLPKSLYKDPFTDIGEAIAFINEVLVGRVIKFRKETSIKGSTELPEFS